MDTQNGIDQEKVEQGEGDPSLEINHATTDQCSSSADTPEISSLKVVTGPETDPGGGEPSPSAASNIDDNNVLNTDQNSISCGDDLQNADDSKHVSKSPALQASEALSNASSASNTSGGSGVEITLDPISGDELGDEDEAVDNPDLNPSGKDDMEEMEIPASDENHLEGAVTNSKEIEIPVSDENRLEGVVTNSKEMEIPASDENRLEGAVTNSKEMKISADKAESVASPVDKSEDIDHPGPSEEREDISDEEFDLQDPVSEDVGGSNEVQSPLSPSAHPSAPDSLRVTLSEPAGTRIDLNDERSSSVLEPHTVQSSESVISKGDVPSSNSSEGGEIIDLKLEDAVLKSGGSSFDEEEHKTSNVPQEDLEAVSDDELPNAPVAGPNLIEGGEQVSSSEDEASAPVPPTSESFLPAVPNLIEGGEQVSSSEDEAPNEGLMPASSTLSNVQDPSDSQPSVGTKEQDKPAHGPIPDSSLQDAEPISDEEDLGQAAESPNLVEGGEAGEIKSPEIGSPISEQGDLMLGEVEPISAEEDSDTDGELPSGDENSNPAGKKDGDKFETIESDEDSGGGVETKKAEKHLKRMSIEGNSKLGEFDIPAIATKDSRKEEYMETISDEEDGQVDISTEMKVVPSGESQPDSSNQTSSQNKGEGFEKRLNQSNFNEHQVELDYEEAEGEDVEQKPAEEAVGKESGDTNAGRTKTKEGGEDGEVEDDDGSDKDEGELSDDDCEEGEIKEPGSKKPFIKPVCRFFQRGNCTWGISCRFIHPGVNDKGNYQMIEIPGFKPVGVHARLGGPPGQWPEGPPPEEPELPPPPMPDVPHTETAWERGLRIAKEQRKKASERKEKEPDFEEKRLNLSIDEERELNKENERMPKIVPKDPYYDQQAYDIDEYYKVQQDPWHGGHYDNFEVRYQREREQQPPPPLPPPPYQSQFRVSDKPPPQMPPPRYNRHQTPPMDKFGRQRDERRDVGRPEPQRPPNDYPSPAKPPDEWTDPWRRSKSPKQRKPRAHSRGKRSKRSLSDSSNSSRSGSRSSSGSSRSSRSGSGSSGSSSRSRSPGPGHQGMGRMDRPPDNRYGDQPRSMVSVRGQGHYDNYRNPRGGYDGDRHHPYNPRQGGFRGGRGGGGGHYNSYGGGGRGGFKGRDPRDQRGGPGGWDGRPPPRHRSPTPDRPLPYVRPRRKSVSSRSSSSRSRSRSRSKYSDSSRSRSSSGSSRSSSSSSSSAGSADSEHMYRGLGSPSRNPRSQITATGKHKQKQRPDNRRDRGNAQPSSQRHNHHHHSQPQPPVSLDRIPHPRDPHPRDAHPRDAHPRDLKSSQIPLPPSGSGRSDSKYASRNAPQAPVKAKDPLKVVGQKSNIKLTLLPKQQQQSGLGERPNPLASPPHKRRLSERDGSPPAKRMNLPVPQTSALRLAQEKAAKIQMRSSGDKVKSPPPSAPSANQVRSKGGISPQKQPSSKSRPPPDAPPSKAATKRPEPAMAGPPPTAPSSSGPSKAKKSMSSRREELLKQLKAVEDAIARKKSKFP